MKKILSLSILSANLIHKEIKMLNNSKADWIHVDIMDSMFVPNISFGITVLKYVRKHSKKPLYLHLMIVEPERYIQRILCGDCIYLHYEACVRNLYRTIYLIKETDIKAGVAINPHTPVYILQNVIKELDIVLLMGVNPGFGGQEIIEHIYQKLYDTKDLILKKRSPALIEIDGGISWKNASSLLDKGADILTLGTTILDRVDDRTRTGDFQNHKLML
jgi:ribulose-phosphate 3-epimerase